MPSTLPTTFCLNTPKVDSLSSKGTRRSSQKINLTFDHSTFVVCFAAAKKNLGNQFGEKEWFLKDGLVIDEVAGIWPWKGQLFRSIRTSY